jgi:hypothetical protein
MDRARLGGLFLVPALVAGLLSAPAAAEPQGSSECSSVVKLDDLHIEAVPSTKRVNRREVFTVEVTVTRPAHHDPLDQGIEWGEPPVSLPAKDVTVGIAIWVGEHTLPFWQIGLTDAEGKDTLRLKVPAKSEYGEGLAAVSARHWIKQDCPDILEESFRYYPGFVKVVP